MNLGNCDRCAFWDRHDKAGKGYCRRYAPRPKTGVEPEDGFDERVVNWPVTFDWEWCGEYVRSNPTMDWKDNG